METKPNNEELKDHTHAEIYFDLRQALNILGQRAVERIFDEAKKDYKINDKKQEKQQTQIHKLIY